MILEGGFGFLAVVQEGEKRLTWPETNDTALLFTHLVPRATILTVHSRWEVVLRIDDQQCVRRGSKYAHLEVYVKVIHRLLLHFNRLKPLALQLLRRFHSKLNVSLDDDS